jgi:transcriptional regulator with XRE-family HTH domain
MFRFGKCLLRQRLQEAGMTQQQLAEKLHMPRSQISDYVHGRKTMSLLTAKSISHAIGCSVDSLYEWIEIPASNRKRSRSRKE